jgi:hypothetical protein
MDARGRRQAVIASVVAASLLVVAAIGTTAFLMIRKQHRTDDVAEAAHVASVFNRKVSTYRSSVQSALTSADSDHAKQVRAAFRAAVAKTPRLGDAPEWGETHSKSYLAATKTEKTLREPYEDISAVLDEAVVGQPFIKAANSALKTDIDDYVGHGTYFYSGAPFRDKLIPGFTKILATFDKVPVPKGQEAVARKVHTALNGVIEDASTAAAELDAGRNTSIDAHAEYLAAGTAVIAYERSLTSRLESAIREAGAEVSGQPTESAT